MPYTDIEIEVVDADATMFLFAFNTIPVLSKTPFVVMDASYSIYSEFDGVAVDAIAILAVAVFVDERFKTLIVTTAKVDAGTV